MSYQRLAEAVLVDLRQVERHIGRLGATSPEAASLETQIVELRDEYQHLIDAARRNGKPVPPPCPIEADRESADPSHHPGFAATPSIAPGVWRRQRL